jgi:hypothetical protein
MVLSAALAALLPMAAAAQERADAERWIYARAKDGALGYEQTTIVKDDAAGEAYGFTFLYTTAPLTGHGLTYHYLLTEHEYDCRGRRIKLLGFDVFDARGMELGGFDVSAPEWKPASSDGVQALLINIICDGANLDASREAASMEAAFAGAAALARQ